MLESEEVIMHKYTVKVEAMELCGFFNYVTVLLPQKVEVDEYNYDFFETLPEVVEAGEIEARDELDERLEEFEEGSEEYEEISNTRGFWSVTEVEYEGEVK